MEIKEVEIRFGYYFWFEKSSYKFKRWLFNIYHYSYAYQYDKTALEITLLGFKIGWSKPLKKD